MYDPKTKDIINYHDLYNVGSTGAPFEKNLHLVGLDGALVLIKAVFDGGAMVNVIDSGLFKQIRHRLSPVRPSSKVLRVANGTLVPSEGLWVGRIIVDGVSTGGLFEIFPSGGSWEMLFGKPMLQAFSATHNFVNDSVTLEAEGLQTIIHNENATQNAKRLRKFKVANASVSNLGEHFGVSPLRLRQVPNIKSIRTTKQVLSTITEVDDVKVHESEGGFEDPMFALINPDVFQYDQGQHWRKRVA